MCLLQRSGSNNNGKEKAAFREGVAFQNDSVNDSLCISCQRMAANHREAKYGTSADASGVQELNTFTLIVMKVCRGNGKHGNP